MEVNNDHLRKFLYARKKCFVLRDLQGEPRETLPFEYFRKRSLFEQRRGLPSGLRITQMCSSQGDPPAESTTTHPGGIPPGGWSDRVPSRVGGPGGSTPLEWPLDEDTNPRGGYLLFTGSHEFNKIHQKIHEELFNWRWGGGGGGRDDELQEHQCCQSPKLPAFLRSLGSAMADTTGDYGSEEYETGDGRPTEEHQLASIDWSFPGGGGGITNTPRSCWNIKHIPPSSSSSSIIVLPEEEEEEEEEEDKGINLIRNENDHHDNSQVKLTPLSYSFLEEDNEDDDSPPPPPRRRGWQVIVKLLGVYSNNNNNNNKEEEKEDNPSPPRWLKPQVKEYELFLVDGGGLGDYQQLLRLKKGPPGRGLGLKFKLDRTFQGLLFVVKFDGRLMGEERVDSNDLMDYVQEKMPYNSLLRDFEVKVNLEGVAGIKFLLTDQMICHGFKLKHF